MLGDQRRAHVGECKSTGNLGKKTNKYLFAKQGHSVTVSKFV